LILAILLAYAAPAQTPVILISIDTLRADHLSAYGHGRIQTPNIAAFASQGTLARRSNDADGPAPRGPRLMNH